MATSWPVAPPARRRGARSTVPSACVCPERPSVRGTTHTHTHTHTHSVMSYHSYHHAGQVGTMSCRCYLNAAGLLACCRRIAAAWRSRPTGKGATASLTAGIRAKTSKTRECLPCTGVATPRHPPLHQFSVAGPKSCVQGGIRDEVIIDSYTNACSNACTLSHCHALFWYRLSNNFVITEW